MLVSDVDVSVFLVIEPHLNELFNCFNLSIILTETTMVEWAVEFELIELSVFTQYSVNDFNVDSTGLLRNAC